MRIGVSAVVCASVGTGTSKTSAQAQSRIVDGNRIIRSSFFRSSYDAPRKMGPAHLRPPANL
jgi:hypothetical protein